MCVCVYKGSGTFCAIAIPAVSAGDRLSYTYEAALNIAYGNALMKPALAQLRRVGAGAFDVDIAWDDKICEWGEKNEGRMPTTRLTYHDDGSLNGDTAFVERLKNTLGVGGYRCLSTFPQSW